jgi:uncharacterized protein
VAGPATLLDVNVLIALFDPDHLHHEIAHDWFADHHKAGWATCPITQTGFVRVLANPAYGAGIVRPMELVERLSQLCKSRHHVFWNDSVSLLDDTLFRASHIAGSRQLTDIYLVGLATKMKGRLATFDRTIPVRAVVGATSGTLAVIAAGPD